MHAVNIGICSNDYLIVTQRVETILYVKGRLQQVEFFVFIDHFLCKPEAVEGFPRKENTAWVFTLRLFVMLPLAESPSVMKIQLSSLRSLFVSLKCTRQSRSFLL